MTWWLNPKLWAAVALAGALAFSHWFVWRAGGDAVRNDWSAERLAVQEARILALRAEAADKERRQQAFNKAGDDATIERYRLAAVADGNASLADGLRAAADRAARAARICADTLKRSPGVPGADPGGMLAVVLGEAQRRLAAVDRYADDIRTRGLACEKSVDALNPQ